MPGTTGERMMSESSTRIIPGTGEIRDRLISDMPGPVCVVACIFQFDLVLCGFGVGLTASALNRWRRGAELPGPPVWDLSEALVSFSHCHPWTTIEPQ